MQYDPVLTSEQVLADLADAVGAMADSTLEEASILKHAISGHKTYVSAVRAVLTGGSIPAQPNPGEGGPVALTVANAADTARALGDNASAVVSGIADRLSAKSRSLDSTTAKEKEEKKGRPAQPKPPDGGGSSAPPGGTVANPPAGDPGATTGSNGGGSGPGGTVANPPGGDSGVTTGPNGGGNAPAGGTTTSGPSGGPQVPGSVTTPTAPAGGGTSVPKVQTPANATAVPDPKKAAVTVLSTKKRRKFCWKFRIRNTTRKPISDLHMLTPATPDFSDIGSGQSPAPPGWQPLNITGTPGFGYQIAKKADGSRGNPIAPGKLSGEFRFCSDQTGFQARTYLTHPDARGNPSSTDRTEISPENVDVNGHPGVRREDGTIGIPPDSREYVYQVTFDTGTSGRAFVVTTSTPVDLSKAQADGAQVSASFSQPRDLNITGKSGDIVDPNSTVTVTLTSKDPALSATITPASFPAPSSPMEQPPLQKSGIGTAVSW